MAVGVHLLLDCYEVPQERLTDTAGLAGMLADAARAAGMTPLSDPVVHGFPGGGVTAFLPLAESHLALHTYPELGYMAADLFTCGLDPAAPERAVEVIRAFVSPGRVEVRRETRGGELGITN